MSSTHRDRRVEFGKCFGLGMSCLGNEVSDRGEGGPQVAIRV